MTRAKKSKSMTSESPRQPRPRADRSASLLLRLLGAHGATLKACGHSIERLVRVRDGLAEQVRGLNDLIEEMHGQAGLARERQGQVQAELKVDPQRSRRPR